MFLLVEGFHCRKKKERDSFSEDYPYVRAGGSATRIEIEVKNRNVVNGYRQRSRRALEKGGQEGPTLMRITPMDEVPARSFPTGGKKKNTKGSGGRKGEETSLRTYPKGGDGKLLRETERSFVWRGKKTEETAGRYKRKGANIHR